MTASSDRDTFGPPPEAQWRTVHKQLQRGKSLHYIRLHLLVKAHSELSSGLGGHKEPSQRESSLPSFMAKSIWTEGRIPGKYHIRLLYKLGSRGSRD